MKKSTITLASLLVVAVFLASCGGLNKMKKNAAMIKYSVTPEVLEMHADSVEINITGSYPAKFFNKKAIVEAIPVLKYENGEKAFKAQMLQGEAAEANHTVISFVEGGTFTYKSVIPYTDDMKISDLEIRAKAMVGTKEVIFDAVKIADGVIATPGLVMADARPIIGADKFQRIIRDIQEADIHFAIQQANLRGAELRQEDVKALRKYIKVAQADERKELKGVDISAYASPDGPQDLNTRLSEQRAVTATKFLGKELRKVKGAKEEGFVKSTTTHEDWAGFKELMGKSDIQDKDLILRVLEMYSDLDRREVEIKNIAAAYLELADDILPKLRRSKMMVNVDVIGYSDEELNTIFDAKADSLNVDELLYTATLSNDLDRQMKVYQACADIYKEDWRGINNVGLTYIKMNKLSDAKQAFENANKLNDGNTVVQNNLGVVALMENDIVAAEEYFVAAAGAGREVNYNQGIVQVKKGDYQAAVDAFGSDCSFNAALAKLLNGDNDAAVKTVDCADNKDEAMMYYLKAIAGARAADTDLMFNNLRAAVSKDASMAAKAKKDMEFGKYFENETFKTIAQ